MNFTEKSPKHQVGIGNIWYTDDQFAKQLSASGPRAIVENRWRVFAEALDNWYPNSPGSKRLRVLDVGCGDGINLFGLERIFLDREREAVLFGLDYNALRLKRAAKIHGVAALVEGSVVRLPFVDGCFDVILCSHVMEHVRDDIKGFAELARVVRPGGLVIVGVPNEGCLVARLRNNIIQPSIARTTDHVHFYVRHALSERLVRVGLEVKVLITESFFMPHLRLNTLLTATRIGRVLLNVLRRMAPSQATGLIAVAWRPPIELNYKAD